MTKFICQVCGYVHEGAEPPEHCPLCNAPKSMFKAADAPAAPPKAAAAAPAESDDARYTSVILSSLANGCDKQHRTEARDLLTELSNLYLASAKKAASASYGQLQAAVAEDLDVIYPQCKAAAEAVHDRGALRVLVWGGKGTMSQRAVLDRYLEEGEKMLEGKNVYVCPVCGYIHIDRQPPEKCPVCSIPPWRFELIEEGGS